MDVRFNPQTPAGVCVSSQISWSNPELLQAIEKVFGTKSTEEIVALDITQNGIQAYFERKK